MSVRIAIILALSIGLVLAGAWISRGFWKPALDRAVAAAFNAQDDASARGIEAEAETDTSSAVAGWAEQRAAARAAGETLSLETREDPDAVTPLAPDRLDRLRRHDQRLCALRPDLAGCAAAAPDAARLGPGAVPPDGPAG